MLLRNILDYFKEKVSRKIVSKRLRNRTNLIIALSILISVFLWYWTDPTPKRGGTIKIYDRNEGLIYESAGTISHQEPVNFEEVPDELISSVVLQEDERYWKHIGIDFQALVRATIQNIRAGEIVSGASTIPQQLVRFTAISPRSRAKVSLIRKIRESLMAIRLSVGSSKEEILEDYLNNMHFGRDIYGVQSASGYYFGKDVGQISLAQSALLAGMIANPTKYDPITNPDNAKLRRDSLLDKLNERDLIDKERLERAISEDLPSEIYEEVIIAPHVIQMVLDEVESMSLGNKGGLNIYTTIDTGWYNFVRDVAKKHVKELRYIHDMENAAVVVLENETGKILVLLGSVDYFDEEILGKNNMALALRQPGSAMKPVTYLAGFIERIATPATVIYDSPKVFLTKSGEGFTPHNYDGRYRGPVLVREALAASYNMPAVEMLERVGINRFIDLSQKMGITTLKDMERYDLAITLGGGEVNLLELTNLYSTLARGGVRKDITLIDKIIDDNGEILFESDDGYEERVVDEAMAFLITDILSDNKARIPTFGGKSPLVTTKPTAVKTGTTTDWHDNWTVGYSPDYTVGVWVGNADNRPMRDISGVTGAAPIWNQVMEELIKFNEFAGFSEPSEIIETEVCAWDGLLPSVNCTERYIEKFILGTQPTEHSTLTEKPSEHYGDGNLQIINPREGAVFEVGTTVHEEIVFEVTNSEDIDNIIWYLNGEELGNGLCRKISNNSCAWKPVLGEYLLDATASMVDGGKVDMEEVEFGVLEYKQQWIENSKS